MNINQIAINNVAYSNKIKNKNTTNSIKHNCNKDINFCGLEALSNQNQMLVKSQDKKYSWELSEEQIAKLREILKRKVHLSENYIPDDRSLSYIFTHVYEYDSIIKDKYFSSEMKSCGLKFFDKFNKANEQEKEVIYNSKLIAHLLKSSNNDSFRRSICDLPLNDVKNYYEEYLNDELIKHCLDDCVQDGIKERKDASKIMDEFDKEIAPRIFGDFIYRPYAKKFYDLLEQRKCADILELTKIIYLNANLLSSDDEIDELHSTLKELLEAKTPDGNFIFGTSENKDQTSKNFLSGIEKILYAKNHNKEEYSRLMQLLQLTKEGIVPSSVLGVLAREGKIDDSFIELVSNNSTNSFIQDENNAKVGDVIEKEDGLYFRNKNGLDKLNLSKETFNKLFPKIETFALSQGANGNCYMVSALFDFIKNPNTRGEIFKMFSEDKDNIIVNIPDSKDKPIVFPKDFTPDEKSINGPMGVQMLESAYAKTRINKNNTQDLSLIEGGEQGKVYNAFFGNNSAEFYTTEPNVIPSNEEIEKIIEDLQSAIEELQSKIENLEDNETIFGHLNYLQDQINKQDLSNLIALQRSYCESLNTKNDNIHLATSDEMINKILNTSLEDNLISVGTKPDAKNKYKMIAGPHAYSVLSIDKNNETIDLINPWNTAQVITLSFGEFKEYFNALDIAKIN